jgi:pentatricopeptide repeat protein
VQEVFGRLENEQVARGLLPDLTTYNTVISAAGQAGDWRTALSLYESLLEVPLAPDKVCRCFCTTPLLLLYSVWVNLLHREGQH